MRSIIFDFADNNEQNLYIQIFDYIKDKILSGEFELGMKLPSLRQLAKENGISVTTVETAYNQLLVEGYIESRPKSGYYVSDDISGADRKWKYRRRTHTGRASPAREHQDC